MNSWHSFSPNSRWLVFSSKVNTPYTQMFLTHIDEYGNDSPPILIPNATAANRAVNLPEFVNIAYEDLLSIRVPAVEYPQIRQTGRRAVRERKLDEALAQFKRRSSCSPTLSRAVSAQAVVLIKQGELDAALANF